MQGKRGRTRKGLKYIVDFAKFLSVFARNGRGILGLIIIGTFIVIALFPGAFTQYDPIGDRFLAGFMVGPTWLRFLPTAIGGDPSISENFYPIKNYDFSNSSLAEWEIANTTHTTWQQEETFNNHSGIVHFAFRRDEVGTTYGNLTVRIQQSFYYPYGNSPWKFTGRLVFFLNGTVTQVVRVEQYKNASDPFQWPMPTRNVTISTFDVPINISYYVEAPATNRKLPIWPNRKYYQYTPIGMEGMAQDGTYVNTTSGWIDTDNALEALDSRFKAINQYIIRTYGAMETPERIYFPPNDCPGTFNIGCDITFFDLNSTKPAKADVYLDLLNFQITGSSWGLMGTDQEGRDLWSQLMYGAKISLYVGVLSSIMAIVIGLIVGLMAGYLGRVVDEFLMRVCDVLLVLPGLPLLIVLIAVLGTSMDTLIILLGALGWMGFARVVRSQVISLRERPFIEAAKAVGASKTHIMFRHILPNVMSLVYVSLATTVPGNIVAEASLGYLGFTDPSRMSWGLMLNRVSENAAFSNWWWVIPPGLCIAAIAIAFILFGYALDEILNPRLRLRR